MKKLFMVCWLGLTLFAKSQIITPSGVVSNMSLAPSPAIVCACDSVKISFKFKVSGSPNALPGSEFNFYYRYYDTQLMFYKFTLIKSLHYYQIWQLVKIPQVIDTVYLFWYKIPCDIITKIGTPGATQLLIDFTLNDGTFNHPLLIKDCTTAIGEYESDESTPVYYNMQGQIVEPKQGEILIRLRGRSRVKVLIQ